MARKDPLAHLPRHPELSASLAREVRALGDVALPALRAMVLDPAADAEGDTPARRAAGNAVLLLASWPGPEADAALLDAFARARPGTAWAARLVGALQERGPEVIAPLLAYRGTERAWDALEALVFVARVHAPGDPRVTDWIVAILRADPAEAADLAQLWRDPALIAPLDAAFDERFARARSAGEDAWTLIALLEAATACGSDDLGRARRMHARLELEVREKETTVRELEAVEAMVKRLPKGR